MHFAILVGGTGPTESIAAVAGHDAHLWRTMTRAHLPLPVPRGGYARVTKKLSERARRVVSNFLEGLWLVSLVRGRVSHSAYRIQPHLRSNARAVDRIIALKIRYSVSDGPRGHCTHYL